MQPDFTAPDFMDNSSAEEIHERMMENLPDDIDDMPGGFPFDLPCRQPWKRRNFFSTT